MSDEIPGTNLRSFALGDDDAERAIVEHKGQLFEVCSPTIAQQTAFERASRRKDGTMDGTKALILGVIGCTFIPGTDKKVFERADEDALMQKRITPKCLMGKLTKALGKLMQPDPEEAEKNSDSTPSDSSSSA